MNGKWNDEVYNHIVVEAHMRCSRCKSVQGFDWDDDELFLKEGWRAYGDFCYCPACVKELKRLCRNPYPGMTAAQVVEALRLIIGR